MRKPLRASAIIAAAVLYVVDAFVLSLPFFALVLFAVVLLYFLPATLWALRSDRHVARSRAAKAGIYLFAAVSIVVTIGMQNSMADRRAVKLGDACLAYRAVPSLPKRPESARARIYLVRSSCQIWTPRGRPLQLFLYGRRSGAGSSRSGSGLSIWNREDS
jgi:hypothetical protein